MVQVLRVVTNTDAPESLRDLNQGSPEARAEYDRLLAKMRQAAGMATRRLLEWIRIDKKQVWTPPPTTRPSDVGGHGLVDIERNEYLGPLTIAAGVLQVVPEGREVGIGDLEVLPTRLREDPPLWARILADAQYYVSSDEWAAWDRAVLFAALACELAIKDALRILARGSEGQLVELLLENPRDWSMAAVALFDKPLKVLSGRSLREDKKKVWKRLNALFQRRNEIAHRATRPAQEDAEELVGAAVEATEWLSEP
jgi:hypothetical protein